MLKIAQVLDKELRLQRVLNEEEGQEDEDEKIKKELNKEKAYKESSLKKSNKF